MTDARREELLNGYLDDDLSAAEIEMVNERLAADAEWRNELSRLRDLQDRCDALPLSIDPPRDLWPQIAERIGAVAAADEPEVVAAPVVIARSWTSRASMRVLLTAASLAAVALLPLAGPGGVSMDTEGIIPAAYGAESMALALDAETRPTAAQMRDWPSASDTEDEAWTALRKDLVTVEAAVVEARDAWLADPENSRLARALTRVCRARAHLILRAQKLSTLT